MSSNISANDDENALSVTCRCGKTMTIWDDFCSKCASPLNGDDPAAGDPDHADGGGGVRISADGDGGVVHAPRGDYGGDYVAGGKYGDNTTIINNAPDDNLGRVRADHHIKGGALLPMPSMMVGVAGGGVGAVAAIVSVVLAHALPWFVPLVLVVPALVGGAWGWVRYKTADGDPYPLPGTAFAVARDTATGQIHFVTLTADCPWCEGNGHHSVMRMIYDNKTHLMVCKRGRDAGHVSIPDVTAFPRLDATTSARQLAPA